MLVYIIIITGLCIHIRIYKQEIENEALCIISICIHLDISHVLHVFFSKIMSLLVATETILWSYCVECV